MKPARAAVDRVAFGVVALASAWFAFAAAWGLFAIPGSGHLGGGAAGNVMAAEQMLRWHIVYPAWQWYTGVEPSKAEYICHHPFGQYWVPAIFLWIFGHRDFVVRLPAVLMSIAIPPLLYGIAKEKWGRPAGAVAAGAYAVLPIAVGFSSFTNLETFCIFGALLFFWGHTRHIVTRRRSHLVASLLGLSLACAGDWCGYLLVAPTIGWALLRGYWLPSHLARGRNASYRRWCALSVALVAATLLLWLGLFHRVHAIGDWLTQGRLRSGEGTMKLKDVLHGRSDWIDFSFTPLAVSLGKIAAPVCLLRLLVTRADEETYSLGLLFGATVQYVAFKQGAQIHIFWAHYFAPYYALALAQLAHASGAVVAWSARRLAPTRARLPLAALTLALGLSPTLAAAHDGIASLWVWRRTGGLYDDNGRRFRSSVDLLEVLRQVVLPRVSRGMPIDVHPSVRWYWEHSWTYQGIAQEASEPKLGVSAWTHPFWIARASGLSADDQRRIASSAHVRVYGDTWLVDQREAPAPLDAYSMNEREPNVLEWLLTNPTEPVRRLDDAPDPWLTWEWRTHLGQDAPLPSGEPRTLEQMRVAHNVAVSLGDAAAAEKWRRRIEAQIDPRAAVKFDKQMKLVGVREVGGVEPRIQSWFEVLEAPPGDATWAVKSTIMRRAPFSLVPPDKADREMAWAPSLPTKLWKPGFLYDTEIVMNHRIGIERYWARWIPHQGQPVPRRPDGRETTLAIVR